jgi:hypothetical protein
MSDPTISRRRLLSAGLAVAAGGVCAWQLLGSDARPPRSNTSAAADVPAVPGRTFGADYESVREIITSAFPFLLLPRETVDDFLQALSATKKRPRKAAEVKQLFLLSTDFFAHGADESRPLNYATLYDPYRNPCYNPMEPA